MFTAAVGATADEMKNLDTSFMQTSRSRARQSGDPRALVRIPKASSRVPIAYPRNFSDLDGFVEAWWDELARRAGYADELAVSGRTLPDLNAAIRRGEQEESERRYWDKPLQPQFKKAIRAARRLENELALLRKLEEQRPKNDPEADPRAALAAALKGKALPRLMSGIGAGIAGLETLAGGSLRLLEQLYTRLKPPNGRPPNARKRAVETALTEARLGDAWRARILVGEGIEEPSRSEDPKAGADRAGKRRRRRGGRK